MKERAFQAFASVVGVYHVILGVSALILSEGTMTSMVQLFLGFNPSVTDEFVLVSRFTGVYVLAFGFFVLLIAREPVRYALFITPVLALFGIRLVNKVILFDEIGAQLDVPTARNVLAVALVAVFFFGLLLTAPPKFYKLGS